MRNVVTLALLAIISINCYGQSSLNDSIIECFFINKILVAEDKFVFEAINIDDCDTVNFVVEKGPVSDTIEISNCKNTTQYLVEKEIIKNIDLMYMFNMRREFGIVIDDEIVLSTDWKYFSIKSIQKR